jgi:hypothetical protein
VTGRRLLERSSFAWAEDARLYEKREDFSFPSVGEEREIRTNDGVLRRDCTLPTEPLAFRDVRDAVAICILIGYRLSHDLSGWVELSVP